MLRAVFAAGLTLLASVAIADPYDPSTYQISGPLRVVGSDTMRELTEAWAEALAAHHPELVLEARHEGSATAPDALASGAAVLAPMSREMTRDEIGRVSGATGAAPVPVEVALDALAVFVNENNPTHGLTMRQLAGVFSDGVACGAKPIESWRRLAIGAPDRKITLHGRNDLSGTFATFKEKALCGGEFRIDVQTHEDSAGVIEAVKADRWAIGYSGVGYESEGVRAISLGVGDAQDEDTRYFPFVVERFADSDDVSKKFAWVVRGRYPMARPLMFYVSGGDVDPMAKAFLDFALSDEGQEIVERVGYAPLPYDRLDDARDALGLN